VEVVASLSQGRTAAAQCGLFTHKSVPVIFEPPCILMKHCTAMSQPTSLPKQNERNNDCSYKCGKDAKLQSDT